MVQAYSSNDIAIARKNSHFVLSERLDFYIVDNLSIVVALSNLLYMFSELLQLLLY